MSRLLASYMSLLLQLKRGAAMALAVSFFLPLSQCSFHSAGHLPEDMSAFSAYQWPSIGSIIVLFLFFWPLTVQLIGRLRSHDVVKRFYHALEVFLCGLSGAIIAWLVVCGSTIRYGAFIAFGAIAIYGAVSLTQIVRR